MSDFLTVTADTAAVEPESTGGQKYQKTPPDPRFWKPTIKNEAKEYQAMVRMLPRGLNGLKNKLNPSVKILTHRLKSEQAKCSSMSSVEKCLVKINSALFVMLDGRYLMKVRLKTTKRLRIRVRTFLRKKVI